MCIVKTTESFWNSEYLDLFFQFIFKNLGKTNLHVEIITAIQN